MEDRLLDAAKEADRSATQVAEEHLAATTEAEMSCEVVTPLMVFPGRFKVTASHILFLADPPLPVKETEKGSRRGDKGGGGGGGGSGDISNEKEIPKNRKWPLDAVRQIHRRRYQMAWS